MGLLEVCVISALLAVRQLELTLNVPSGSSASPWLLVNKRLISAEPRAGIWSAVALRLKVMGSPEGVTKSPDETPIEELVDSVLVFAALLIELFACTGLSATGPFEVSPQPDKILRLNIAKSESPNNGRWRVSNSSMPCSLRNE